MWRNEGICLKSYQASLLHKIYVPASSDIGLSRREISRPKRPSINVAVPINWGPFCVCPDGSPTFEEPRQAALQSAERHVRGPALLQPGAEVPGTDAAQTSSQ